MNSDKSTKNRDGGRGAGDVLGGKRTFKEGRGTGDVLGEARDKGRSKRVGGQGTGDENITLYI